MVSRQGGEGEGRPLRPEQVAPARSGTEHWTALLLLLPAICCGAPLLLAAVVALGLGTWLAANRLLVGSGLALIAAALLVVVRLRRRMERHDIAGNPVLKCDGDNRHGSGSSLDLQ
jgi:hypothetical protein